MKKIVTILFCAPIFAIAQTLSPELIASSGGGNSQLQWSLGEPVVLTIEGASGILTQGFHQTLLTITSVDEVVQEGIEIEIFPNPVMHSFTIQLNQSPIQPVLWKMVDSSGKVVMQETIHSSANSYNVSDLSSGVYFLHLIFSDEQSKTWRIVKQN